MDIYKLRKILKRYTKGRSNETESALVEAWYKSYAVEEKKLSDNDAQLLRAAISRNIKAATVKRPIFYLPAFRVAASIAIVCCASFLGWRIYKGRSTAGIYYTVNTGTNGLKQITLPDGSTVWVNAASRLRVPQAFEGKLREIFLDEGEAFFDVKHNNEQPFIVHSAAINVQVLGTSFNVRAYKNLNSVDVSVSTGKVGVSGRQGTLAMLLPGEQLSFNTLTGVFEKKDINDIQAQSWKKGYTYLTQASFKELSTVVHNIYGLSIKPGNKKVNDYKFSLRLMHNLPSGQIVALISKIHHTHFRKEGNDIILY